MMGGSEGAAGAVMVRVGTAVGADVAGADVAGWDENARESGVVPVGWGGRVCRLRSVSAASRIRVKAAKKHERFLFTVTPFQVLGMVAKYPWTGSKK